MLKFLKKLWNQLLGRANDAIEKHSDPIVDFRQGMRLLDAEIENVNGQMIQASHDLHRFDQETGDLQKQIDEVHDKARRAKANDHKERAIRYLSRKQRLEGMYERQDKIRSKLVERIDKTRQLYVDLGESRSDLAFELHALEADQKMANFTIGTNGGTVAGSKLTDINKIVENARKRVSDTMLLADAHEDVAQFKAQEVESEEKAPEASADLQKAYESL